MKKVNLLSQINYAVNEYKLNGRSKKFEELCQQVIDSQNAANNVKFASVLVKTAADMDVLAHGKVVLEYGTAQDNYNFARLVKGADTRAHRDKIIASGSIEYNVSAGKSFGLNDGLTKEYVNKHGEVISRFGGITSNYEYLKNNKIANFDKTLHLEKIIESKDATYNLKVGKNIKGIDIEPHSKIVAEFGTAEQNYEFLQIQGSNTTRHLIAIAKSQDVVTNLRCLIEQPINPKTFAKHVKIVFSSTDNEAKYEAVVWAKSKGYLNQLAECVPEIVQFVKDVKANKILVGSKNFRFLDKNDIEYRR